MFSTRTPIEPLFTLVKFCPYLLVFFLCMVHFFVCVTHECLGVTIRYLHGFLGLLTPARSQVSIFGGAQYILRGKDFGFTVRLKQIFLGVTKFGGHKRNLGVHCPECRPVATGLS